MPPSDLSPSSAPARRFVRGLCLWVLLPLALCLAAGAGSLALICAYKPELVASSVQQYLISGTGLPWRIRGPIRPVFAPYPGIVVSDVRILAASTEQSYLTTARPPLVQAQALRLYIDPSSLLELRPKANLIELDTPVVSLAYDAYNRPLWLPLSGAAQPPLPERDAPSAGNGTTDETMFRGSGTASTKLQSATAAFCAPPKIALQPVHIRNGSFMSYAEDGTLLLSFTGVEGHFDPDGTDANLELAASFAVPAATLDLRFSLSALVGCDGIPARGTLAGTVAMTPPQSRSLTGDFTSPFAWNPDGTITLPGFSIVAEGDALTASLVLEPDLARATGEVQIHRLSLPRWFLFGRVLPPGLRQTLDALVGRFDLYLDMHKAEARNLRGVVGPLAVTGYVGAPDFGAPVVTVDLDVGRANLDLIFPFLAAVGKYVPDPLPPEFDHLYLAPFPEDPAAPPPPEDAPPGIEVGYDVKVRVAQPSVHDVEGGPLEVLVLPATVDGVEKTRVSFTASSLIEGSVKGHLDIDDTSILMRYDVKDMELGLLPENAQNTVRIAGKVTGSCDIGIPLLPDGDFADDWSLKVDAAISKCAVTGHHQQSPWRLFAGQAKAAGSGSIHSVRSKGIRIEGLWNLKLQNINTSWNPKGNDAITGTFNGGLFWPPIADRPRETKGRLVTIEKRGVDHITGKLTAKGSLVVPLGSLKTPLDGTLESDLDWRLYGETIRLDNMAFKGFGSYATGKMDIDFSGQAVEIDADTSFKLNPPELLQKWNISTGSSFAVPKLLTGRTDINSKGDLVKFEKLKVEADGAPISGEITWQGGGKNGSSAAGQWNVRLSADHLDLDRYFPPATPEQKAKPPSTTPWDLSFFKDLSLDAQIFLLNAKWHKLNFAKTKLTATLQKDRFSLHSESGGFYGGTSTFLLQGSILPERSQINLRKGLAQVQNANLGTLLYDYSKDRSYGGAADLIVDVAGVLSSNADIPAKLSGVWSLSIADGVYPAFLAGEDSSLRNTFSSASLSGTLEKGVLRSGNFVLTGAMVDMSGGGWMDLASADHDFTVSVTFAKIPTVPVRFYGKKGEARMQVKGVDMVVETVQAAGTTVFSLVTNVLELPGYAIKGLTSIFGGGSSDKGGNKRQPPQTMPVPKRNK